MKLTTHQQKLLELIREYGPVICQSSNIQSPRRMLDGTIWCNWRALDALVSKNAIVQTAAGWRVPVEFSWP